MELEALSDTSNQSPFRIRYWLRISNLQKLSNHIELRLFQHSTYRWQALPSSSGTLVGAPKTVNAPNRIMGVRTIHSPEGMGL